MPIARTLLALYLVYSRTMEFKRFCGVISCIQSTRAKKDYLMFVTLYILDYRSYAKTNITGI